jgi:hypothetical protein
MEREYGERVRRSLGEGGSLLATCGVGEGGTRLHHFAKQCGQGKVRRVEYSRSVTSNS